MKNIEDLISNFIATFEKRDGDLLAPFFTDDILFTNYGNPTVRGKDQVIEVWKRVFHLFHVVRFETVNQAVNSSIVLAEQIHHLTLPGREAAPVYNMACYEIRDGRIAVWRDYSDSKYARQLLEATKPLAE
jgi:limonene-1,2-epoxide hydrolase